MKFHHQIQWIRISMKMSLTPLQVLRLSRVRNMLVIGLSLSNLYNFCFLLEFRLLDMVCFHWFIQVLLAFWGHLGLTLLCEVPHCVEDRTLTPRCFFLDRFDLEMDSCLLDIYPISCLFHMTFINSMHTMIFHYQIYSIRG